MCQFVAQARSINSFIPDRQTGFDLTSADAPYNSQPAILDQQCMRHVRVSHPDKQALACGVCVVVILRVCGSGSKCLGVNAKEHMPSTILWKHTLSIYL